MATPIRARAYYRPRSLGVTNLQMGGEGVTLAVASYSAGSAIAAGAAAGSVVGPIGAAVGALAGIVAGLLQAKPNTAAHIGQWDGQLVNAMAALPQPNGIGRQFPWNEDGHGLTQMIEAILACGLYMQWDPQILANYDVCAHWAMTFANLAQTVVTGVCKNPAGASVTAQITSQPGGPVGAAPFTFKNPGVGVGPAAIAAQTIMGPSGAMTWLFNRWQIAGSPALSKQYAASMGNNAYAQKVFGLMADYVAAQVAPAASIPVTAAPPVAKVIPVASSAGKTAVTTTQNTGKPAPIPVATPIQTQLRVTLPLPEVPTQPNAPLSPIVAVTPTGVGVTAADIANLVAAIQAQGASASQAQSDALSALQAQGVNTNMPAVQDAVQAAVAPSSSGIDMTTLLIGAAVLGGAYLLLK